MDGGSQSHTHALAMVVIALLRDDETKLKHKAKKLVKKQKSYALKVFTQDVDGWTPVHACALKGSKKLLKIMLNAGIDVNIRMGEPEGLPRSCSLLHIAANRGDITICNYLIDSGADVHATDSQGHTPVYYAARHRRRNLLRVFEENGADVITLEKYFPNLNSELSLDCMTPQPKSTHFCFFGNSQ